MASKPKQSKSRKSRKGVKKPRVRRRVNRRLKVAGQLTPHVHNIVVNNNVPVSRMEQRTMPVVPRDVLVRRAEDQQVMRDRSTQTVFATPQDAYFANVQAPAAQAADQTRAATPRQRRSTRDENNALISRLTGAPFQGTRNDGDIVIHTIRDNENAGRVLHNTEPGHHTRTGHHPYVEGFDTIEWDSDGVQSSSDGSDSTESVEAISPPPLLAPPLLGSGIDPRFLSESLTLTPQYVQRLDNTIDRLNDDGSSSSSSTSDERAERAERYMMGLNDVNYALRRGQRIRRPRVPFTPS